MTRRPDLRQFASGYVGLQNHSDNDLIEFRNIRVQALGTGDGPFDVTAPGPHTVEFRTTDTAGNVEAARSVTFTIPGTPPPPGSQPPQPPPPGGTEPGAAFGLRSVQRPRLGTFARRGLRVTVGCDATGAGRAALTVTRSVFRGSGSAARRWRRARSAVRPADRRRCGSSRRVRWRGSCRQGCGGGARSSA